MPGGEAGALFANDQIPGDASERDEEDIEATPVIGQIKKRTAAPRLPLSTKLTYGFGSIAEGVKNVAFKTFLLFYYNQVLGLPGWMGGAAGAVALIVDAITDPLIGSLSDGTRSAMMPSPVY